METQLTKYIQKDNLDVKETLKEYFSKYPKRRLTMGMEFECYLYDLEGKHLLGDEEILNDILQMLPIEVTRDYYTYQLEIRTRPHTNPEDLINEFITLLKKCEEVTRSFDVKIVPLSWMGGSEMFNGIHFHFRNGDRNHFENMMANSYPFILALTDCFKHSPRTEDELTYRFANTQHCNVPCLQRFLASPRYSDITLNRFRENNRHRLKNKFTIEVRTFDLPHNIEYLKNLIRLMFNLMKNINTTNKLVIDEENVYNRFCMTRKEIMYNKEGYNYHLGMPNKDIYNFLCDKFDITKLNVPFINGILGIDVFNAITRSKRNVKNFLLEI